MKSLANSHAVNLFVYLVEKLIDLFSGTAAQQEELILPSLYIAFSFIEKYENSNLISENKLWTLNHSTDETKSQIYSFVSATLSMLNELNGQLTDYNEDLSKFEDYPLAEDRMLDSFLPFKDIHASLNFSKYMRTRMQSVSAIDENMLCKRRILNCIQRALTVADNKSCFILLVDRKKSDEVVAKRIAFKINQETCQAPPDQKY